MNLLEFLDDTTVVFWEIRFDKVSNSIRLSLRLDTNFLEEVVYNLWRVSRCLNGTHGLVGSYRKEFKKLASELIAQVQVASSGKSTSNSHFMLHFRKALSRMDMSRHPSNSPQGHNLRRYRSRIRLNRANENK